MQCACRLRRARGAQGRRPAAGRARADGGAGGRPLDHPRGDPPLPGARRHARRARAAAPICSSRSRPPPSTCRCRSTRRICATRCCRRWRSAAASRPRPAWSPRAGAPPTTCGSIEEKLNEMERVHLAKGTSGPEDLAFHLAIYDATHNPLFRQLLEQMREAFERFWEHPFDRPGFRPPVVPVPPRRSSTRSSRRTPEAGARRRR